MKINITDKLQQEKPILEIKGHEFEIDNSKNAVLAFEQKNFKDKKSIEITEEIILHFAGETALQIIQNMNLSYKDYDRIAVGIMALATETTYEETEQRFQKPITK